MQLSCKMFWLWSYICMRMSDLCQGNRLTSRLQLAKDQLAAVHVQPALLLRHGSHQGLQDGWCMQLGALPGRQPSRGLLQRSHALSTGMSQSLLERLQLPVLQRELHQRCQRAIPVGTSAGLIIVW